MRQRAQADLLFFIKKMSCEGGITETAVLRGRTSVAHPRSRGLQRALERDSEQLVQEVPDLLQDECTAAACQHGARLRAGRAVFHDGMRAWEHTSILGRPAALMPGGNLTSF